MKRLLPALLCLLLALPAAYAEQPDNRPGDDPWISGFDTARDVRFEGPGYYMALDHEELTAGMYTVTTDAQCEGELVTAFNDGWPVNVFSLRGETSYTFYLGPGMTVTIPEHAVLTAIDKNVTFPAEPGRQAIRQGRYMLWFQMPYKAFTVTAMEGEEAYVVFSDMGDECGQSEPKVFPLPAGETLTFDNDLDGVNDPMPRQHFASSSRAAYFIEFVNCVVEAVE